MKQVVAVVRPFLAEKVLDAIQPLELKAINVREVKGFGRQKSYLDRYSDGEYALTFLPKIEITLWIEDHLVQEAIDHIAAAARIGRMGDGKIFVQSIGRSIDLDAVEEQPPESIGDS
ncbi:MAG: P-II family nitrogen regulator [Pirellulaceae bacterium]